MHWETVTRLHKVSLCPKASTCSVFFFRTREEYLHSSWKKALSLLCRPLFLLRSDVAETALLKANEIQILLSNDTEEHTYTWNNPNLAIPAGPWTTGGLEWYSVFKCTRLYFMTDFNIDMEELVHVQIFLFFPVSSTPDRKGACLFEESYTRISSKLTSNELPGFDVSLENYCRMLHDQYANVTYVPEVRVLHSISLCACVEECPRGSHVCCIQAIYFAPNHWFCLPSGWETSKMQVSLLYKAGLQKSVCHFWSLCCRRNAVRRKRVIYENV